ncbi:RNA polymerase sigma factor [Thauera linaloolentis]|uniref:RNA polymerase ECF-subfamily sigma-70 factor n=1 Tax=Thauera linaloolentis (strain DSM 12138 / JCM 21573 / CCUG 41526 / CIP 105981 / IAM 15112 / NBRC 102519 / 47Lol) TaxID=1123367 RepID=N6YZA0_THAL4|nr:sigma-70 family RNA polymerase sigma factor [Thauera linaloolentis]ENO87722.1 RNA polymerase ECF-subfamily sigma-70 factor [Thauera linaloolentis 47Lol = DSM 12138]MCM8567588.1 sigma-70 family RNA polymerase sigma factor [Thauera linaloolentis]
MTHRPLSKKGWLANYSELIGGWRRKPDADDDALDALQDAVLRMLEAGVGKVANPAAYLKRSIQNHKIDKHRHQTAFPSIPLDELDDHAVSELPGPEAEAHSSKLLADLQSALEELPLVCRQVYIHHRIEGCTHAEIARALGISTDMVEKHMTRAVRHLNNRLQHYA